MTSALAPTGNIVTGTGISTLDVENLTGGDFADGGFLLQHSFRQTVGGVHQFLFRGNLTGYCCIPYEEYPGRFAGTPGNCVDDGNRRNTSSKLEVSR